jgi:hypothetical protein
MKKHQLNNYNNNLINTFNKISIGRKYNIIGSSALKNNRYFNDYDIDDYFQGTKPALTKITTHFKNLFKETYKNPDGWIIDLKVGIDPNYNKDEDGYKLRWTKKDIMNGFKILKDGQKKYFKDCILDKSMFKLDYILLLNGQFVEISEKYIIKIGNENNIVSNSDIKEELKKDIQKYKKENKMKALKREFSILKLEGKNQKKIKMYEDIFNSDLGYMNNIINQLKTISLMLEQDFKKVDLNDIYNNLQILKQNLSFFNTKNLSDEIDSLCNIKNKKYLYNSLEKIINYLNNYLNNQI